MLKKKSAMLQARMRAIFTACPASLARSRFSAFAMASSQPASTPSSVTWGFSPDRDHPALFVQKICTQHLCFQLPCSVQNINDKSLLQT